MSPQVVAPPKPPAPPPASTTPTNKKGPAFAIGLVVASLLVALLPSEARILHPYKDSAGIWTICMGLIDPAIVWRHKGTDFTVAECEIEEKIYITKMVNEMVACVSQEVIGRIKADMFIWLGHWAYNTGTGAFCKPTNSIQRNLNANDFKAACEAMGKWTFITVKGQKVNCRTAGRLCPGIVKRRDLEVSKCLAAL